MDDGECASAREVALALLDGTWLHVDQFPDVAIEVLKSVAIHESVVLRFIVGGPAAGARLTDQ